MEHKASFNPFPGLRPFAVEEDYLFFGREPQTAELVKRLRQNRFLAVVGTSGSGKSSLVRAGMIPTLLAGRMMKAGSRWEVAMMRPGGNPITHLAEGLCAADLYDRELEQIVPHLRATLSRSRLGLVEAVRQSAIEPGTNLLLVVDQFEEIFRFRRTGIQEREQAVDFVNLLLEASQQTERAIFVVITMRSDFIGDCSRFEGLAEAVNDGEFLIPRLSRQQCQMAIEGPAKVAGGRIDSRLVQRLLNDLGEDQDELPILQHSLMRTWDHAASRNLSAESADSPAPASDATIPTLEVEDYEAIGGMKEALSRHADEVYQTLPDERHRQVTERVFKALTERGADNRGIRRPTRFLKLAQICAAKPDEIAHVLDAFRQPGVTFLMPPQSVELHADTVVDISHESLMRVWRRLHGWVEDEAQSARIYRRLAESAHLHQEGKADLYHDPDLQIALSWQTSTQPTEAWASRYHDGFETALEFLRQSGRAKQSEIEAKEAARQRELDQARALTEAQRLRMEEQARAARWLKGWIVGAAVIAVIAIMAFFAARSARDQAEQNSQLAERARQRAVNSEEQVAQQAREFKRKFYGANLLKAKYWHEAGNGGRAVQALMDCPEDLRHWEWHRLKYLTDQGETLVQGLDQLAEAIFSPDGRTILSSRRDGIYQLWDAATGAELWWVTQDALPFSGRLIPSFSWDGKIVFTPDINTLHLRDSSTGQSIKTVPGQFMAVYTSSNRTFGLSLGSVAQIVNLDEDTAAIPLQEQSQINFAAFSPDGTWLVACDWSGRCRFWHSENGEKFGAWDGQLGPVRTLIVSPDGTQVLLSDAFGRIKRWDTVAGTESRALSGHEMEVTAAAYSPDGQRIVSGDSTTLIKVWDTRTGAELGTFRGHASQVNSLDFSPDPDTPLIVSTSSDGTIRLWKPEPVSPVMTFKHGNRDTQLRHLDFSPNGTLLATTGFDDQVRIWDLATGEEVATLGHTHNVVAVDFSPDGKQLASGQYELGRVKLWDTDTWEPIQTLDGPIKGVAWVTYSPNGKLIAAAGEDRKVFLWNAETGVPYPSLELDLKEGGIDGLAFSPDGERVGVCFGGTRLGQVRVLDVATGTVIKTFQGPESDMRSVLFSPDGEKIAVGVNQTKETLIWDLESGELVQRLRGHHEDVLAGAFSPDGQRLFSGSRDDSVRVFDVGSGEELLLIDKLGGNIWGVAVSPDGRTVAAAQEFGTVYVWKTVIPSMTLRLQANQKEQQRLTRLNTLFRQGQWKELVRHYLDVVQAEPDESMHWQRAAAVLVLAGDREGYQQLCEDMLEHFSEQRNTEACYEAERTTKTCLLLPGVIEHSRLPLERFSEPMDQQEVPDWFFAFGSMTLSLAALRSDDAAGAVEWAERSLSRQPVPVVMAGCQMILAQAYQRLGRTREARQALDEGAWQIQSPFEAMKQGEISNWWDWHLADMLRREAEALITIPNRTDP